MGEGLAEQSGISLGTLIGSLHRLRELLKPVMSRLIEEYRSASVKHADETGWRNNGNNGYAWLFSTPDTAIFRLRKTRGGQIALEMFGDKRLPSVLVVDRYNGRMYHWSKGRNIPADNNFAERELRNLVISRKVSFGS